MNYVWCGGAAVLALMSGGALLACSKHGPAQLPMAGIYARGTARIEVCEIVVTDRHRAQHARAIYLQIAELGEQMAAQRARDARRLVTLTSRPSLDPAAIHAAVHRLEADQRAAFQEYVALQMELRKTLTQREFTQLGRFK